MPKPSRKQTVPYAPTTPRGPARNLNASANRMEFGAGSLKQRDVDKAVKAVGGRTSKAYQAARELAPQLRDADKIRKRTNPLLWSMEIPKSAKAILKLEALAKDKKIVNTLAKASVRGMLSPAGLAEEAAGRAVSEAQKKQYAKGTRPQDIAEKKAGRGVKRPNTRG